MEIWVTWVNEL